KYQTAVELENMQMKWFGNGQDSVIYKNENMGQIPAGTGSDFSTDYAVNEFRIGIRGNEEHFEGYVCFYAFMRGEIKEEHVNVIWNNGFPIMPKPEWNYDWQVILKFDDILNPTTAPELSNYASDVNTQAGNYRIYLNNYSATELDNRHNDYVIRNLNLLK
ncbi:MAG: hypothetical protein WBA74_23775, partial [Cyclobacteriaceae bacterium]